MGSEAPPDKQSIRNRETPVAASQSAGWVIGSTTSVPACGKAGAWYNRVIMAIVIRAHFDGKVIVPDEPLDLPVGPLVAEIRDASASEARRRVLETWEAFTANPVPDVHISDESLRREHLYEPPRGL